MEDIKKLVDGLRDADHKYAYSCLQKLETKSNDSNRVYPYFDSFVEMLNHENSYIRTRGIVLIAANAKWDIDNKIDEIIDEYLKHIMDDKPITSRQCIKVLPTVAKYKPDLKACICSALEHANPMVYQESMQSLVYKDIRSALENINA